VDGSGGSIGVSVDDAPASDYVSGRVKIAHLNGVGLPDQAPTNMEDGCCDHAVKPTQRPFATLRGFKCARPSTTDTTPSGAVALGSGLSNGKSGESRDPSLSSAQRVHQRLRHHLRRSAYADRVGVETGEAPRLRDSVGDGRDGYVGTTHRLPARDGDDGHPVTASTTPSAAESDCGAGLIRIGVGAAWTAANGRRPLC
jgi:hypothetical protein